MNLNKDFFSIKIGKNWFKKDVREGIFEHSKLKRCVQKMYRGNFHVNFYIFCSFLSSCLKNHDKNLDVTLNSTLGHMWNI